MKSKVPGIVVLIIGLGLITTGIVAKRALNMPEYLIVFHSLGGLSLVIGISLLFLGRQNKD